MRQLQLNIPDVYRVKHYIGDEHPSLAGANFDLSVAEDRAMVEDFAHQLNVTSQKAAFWDMLMMRAGCQVVDNSGSRPVILKMENNLVNLGLRPFPAIAKALEQMFEDRIHDSGS